MLYYYSERLGKWERVRDVKKGESENETSSNIDHGELPFRDLRNENFRNVYVKHNTLTFKYPLLMKFKENI